MKYSISNWIFGKEPLEDGFQRLAKFGYDGIELRGEFELYKVDELQGLIVKYKLGVLSICGMYPGPEKDQLRDLSHPRSSITPRQRRGGLFKHLLSS